MEGANCAALHLYSPGPTRPTAHRGLPAVHHVELLVAAAAWAAPGLNIDGPACSTVQWGLGRVELAESGEQRKDKLDALLGLCRLWPAGIWIFNGRAVR